MSLAQTAGCFFVLCIFSMTTICRYYYVAGQCVKCCWMSSLLHHGL